MSEDYITRGWAKLPAYVKNIEDERDTLRAELAASEARAERLEAMLEHKADEAAEMERMLRSEYAKAESHIRALHIVVSRYRDETPIGHQPHMIAHQADAVLGRAALAERAVPIPALEEEDLLAAYYAGEESGYRRGRKEAPQPVSAAEVPMPEHVEQLAITRYRPVPNGMFGYKVVAGDGARSVFEGTKSECTLIARKLTEAFLDGAHVAGDAREAAGYARGKLEAVPSGYWLAPVEPTPEMKSAGLNVEVGENNHVLTWTEVAAIYREMWDASLRGEVKP